MPKERIAFDTVSTDSLLKEKILLVTPDSARVLVLKRSLLDIDTPGWFFLQREREESGQDFIFYYLLLLFLFFGIIRVSYPRYSSDIFRFYFQSTLRVNQIREQLSHSVIPAMLYDLLFFLASGAYLFLLSEYYQLSFTLPRLYLPLTTVGVLLVVYGFKQLFVRFLGWAFQVSKAARLYLFVIFLTNKFIGLLLLPLLAGIAFGVGTVKEVFITLSVVLIAFLFVFRFLRAYQTLSGELKLKWLTYFLYLTAAEILPLLLIYKLLMEIL
ncbi:MAG: DUF4271 domain-containing protein [Bacteroidetes bacterium]|nr:DUF4271 domain-containing protein [Bacteroidota bacterium]